MERRNNPDCFDYRDVDEEHGTAAHTPSRAAQCVALIALYEEYLSAKLDLQRPMEIKLSYLKKLQAKQSGNRQYSSTLINPDHL